MKSFRWSVLVAGTQSADNRRTAHRSSRRYHLGLPPSPVPGHTWWLAPDTWARPRRSPDRRTTVRAQGTSVVAQGTNVRAQGTSLVAQGTSVRAQRGSLRARWTRVPLRRTTSEGRRAVVRIPQSVIDARRMTSRARRTRTRPNRTPKPTSAGRGRPRRVERALPAPTGSAGRTMSPHRADRGRRTLASPRDTRPEPE